MSSLYFGAAHSSRVSYLTLQWRRGTDKKPLCYFFHSYIYIKEKLISRRQNGLFIMAGFTRLMCQGRKNEKWWALWAQKRRVIAAVSLFRKYIQLIICQTVFFLLYLSLVKVHALLLSTIPTPFPNVSTCSKKHWKAHSKTIIPFIPNWFND